MATYVFKGVLHTGAFGMPRHWLQEKEDGMS